jgi:uncharacterized protein (DUF697 family)
MRLLKNKDGAGSGKIATGLGMFGAVGTVKTLYDVMREVSFDDIRDEANRAPRMLVLATTSEEAEQYARLITGTEAMLGIGVGTLDTQVWNVGGYDAVVVHDPLNSGAAQRLKVNVPEELQGPSVVNSNVPFDQAEARRARLELAGTLDDRAIAFARVYPSFRPAVIAGIVNDTSTANAQFAFVSNIPALIPVVGGFLAAGADMIVLTKNQLMMVYKVAAASGRKLDDQHAIIRELIPVIGSGFLWRTMAREAAAFLPLAAGAIPKVAIAFTGTYALGRAAEMFYRFGKKPTQEQRAEFYEQARELVLRLPFLKYREQKEAIEETTESIERERPDAAA